MRFLDVHAKEKRTTMEIKLQHNYEPECCLGGDETLKDEVQFPVCFRVVVCFLIMRNTRL